MLYPAELRGPGKLHIGLDTCCPSMFHELAALRPKKPAIMRLQQGRWGRLNIAAPEEVNRLECLYQVGSHHTLCARLSSGGFCEGMMNGR